MKQKGTKKTKVPEMPRQKCWVCYGKGEVSTAIGPVECNTCSGTGKFHIDLVKTSKLWRELHLELERLRGLQSGGVESDREHRGH